MRYLDKLDLLGFLCIVITPPLLFGRWVKKHWQMKHIDLHRMPQPHGPSWGHGPRRVLKKHEIFFEGCWVCSRAKIYRLWCYTGAFGVFHLDVYIKGTGGPRPEPK